MSPRDGTHFVRLFADAQFYSLPKLISQLYEESLFVSIGHREFHIPRTLFADPGNSPNFFSLGFAFFFSHPATDGAGGGLFPGLEREGLIRPPSILPPSVPNRSAATFAELLHLLRGYPLHVRDAAHRAELLRDCRYFNFKGLEQRLIPHARSFNQQTGRDEIALRLEDILKSGISVAAQPTTAGGWGVTYARPFVDTAPADLVLEIGGENLRLHFPTPHSSSPTLRVEFFRDARTRIAKLFEVLASKLNLPNATTAPLGLLMAAGGTVSQPNTPLSGGEDWVKAVVGAEAAVVLDGRGWRGHRSEEEDDEDESSVLAGLDAPPPRKRKRAEDDGFGGGSSWVERAVATGHGQYWVLRTGQWRLRIQSAADGRGGVEGVLVAVKLDAMSGEHARNEARGFLND